MLSTLWDSMIQSKIFVIRLSFHNLHHESSLLSWISIILEFWKSVMDINVLLSWMIDRNPYFIDEDS